MISKFRLVVLLLFATSIGFAQTKEELKAEKAKAQKVADSAQAVADGAQAKIDALPGWRKAIFGTLGFSISEQRNAFTQGVPNNSTGNIGISVNAYANLIEEKFFWRNSGLINFAWTRLDDRDDPNDNDSFEPTTDIFTLTSLYGRNISKKWAVSALAEYRTTVLNDFNDPGYLDFGVGFTWTPITNLVVVIHPANYNFVFSSGDTIFESSLGAKIVADYTRKVGAINFKTNLSAFISYEEVDDLSNWTWNNSFSYTLWKKIGVGFDFGLRSNKQEALNFALNQNPATATSFDDVDNDLQTYWTFGLSYAF
ncbi:DUF3078 domain-containing protein [Winogradskyella immobilis]|uniref:DUF3078 domain-containing protein n=1 Tax=Winogradskyella immobilis TaxID=2816852 RepID=A0ABS8EJF8_9FLAO|nr:DUF3078 domain-containing protein [Winogradskyella immobilis]MCC1483333.1 DUF3078 domain-containing protein [Winogradskyella immobilis]MCG0015427.1 DUF3078 domain-containing protein [Winogradskyella immobilis]